MYIDIDKLGQITLKSPNDFKSFKIVFAKTEQNQSPRILIESIGKMIDERTAWISQESVLHLAGSNVGVEWKLQFETMIEKAAAFGWIDQETGAIKGHIEIGN